MSIEDEIRNRKPVPVWEGLEKLDRVAAQIKQGYEFQYAMQFREVQRAAPKALPRPPIVVADLGSSIKHQSSMLGALRALEALKQRRKANGLG